MCLSVCVHKVGADILFLIPRIKDCIDSAMWKRLGHEGKSSLSRLTSSTENSFLPTAYRFLECQEKKYHCELSQVQSVAALPMLLEGVLVIRDQEILIVLSLRSQNVRGPLAAQKGAINSSHQLSFRMQIELASLK